MILVRSPLRLSLGGGGTDLESYYSKRGGFLVAAAIDKFVYIAIHRSYNNEWILKYSNSEHPNSFEEIRHPIFRECLKKYCSFSQGLEITSFADIPGGTGLGSSSSFTTALIKGLQHLNLTEMLPNDLAERACEIEIDFLKEPIGKQDQYISAWGGARAFHFNKDGSVESAQLYLDPRDLVTLSQNFILVYTGETRSASSILSTQKKQSVSDESEMIKNLDEVKRMGYKFYELLKEKKFSEYGRLMRDHWTLKKARSPEMTNKKIDQIYDYGLHLGANGGKLVGAGGGGFILFQSENINFLRQKFSEKGLRTVDFNICPHGTEVVRV